MSEDRREKVVEYLIGEMPRDEATRFEQSLGSDPELSRMVDEMRPVVSRLEALPDEAWEQPEPPPLVMPVERPAGDQPVAASEPASADRSVRSWPRRLWPSGGPTWPRLATGLAMGLALLVVGFYAGTLSEDSGSGSGSGTGPAPARTLAMDALGEAPSGASGQVDLTSSTGDPVTLEVRGLKPSPGNEFYELWLLGKNGELVALGSFRVGADGESRVQVPLPVNPEKYQYFDISIQPDNGSPDHSGRSVLRGPTSSA